MYCGSCGKEVQDDWDKCPYCGAGLHPDIQEDKSAQMGKPSVSVKSQVNVANTSKRSSNVSTNDSIKEEQRKNPVLSKKNIILASCAILAIALICVGAFAIYPAVQASNQAKDDQKMADEEMDLINAATAHITVDSDSQLQEAQQKYFSLTEAQKELVTNYDQLENGFVSLQDEKDKATAQVVVDEIDAIDPNSLTYDDTSVAVLKNNFDALTDTEKSFVTNSGKITQYEEVIQGKKDEKQKQEEADAAAKAQAEADAQAAEKAAAEAQAAQAQAEADARAAAQRSASNQMPFTLAGHSFYESQYNSSFDFYNDGTYKVTTQDGSVYYGTYSLNSNNTTLTMDEGSGVESYPFSYGLSPNKILINGYWYYMR